jgi:ribulose-5-phosphate 4-epimerase/fuculose-1-phosphate aldolase
MSHEIAEARRDLAAVLRWSCRLGLSEGICNHYSYTIDRSHFLVNPFGYHWSELKASQMLLVDHNGAVVEGSGKVEPTAMFIHSQIHRALPTSRCVLHTHMPYATAITTIQNGRLEMASQNALRFYGNISYDDDYQGLALDDAEGRRICRQIGDKQVLFLANHGVIVLGQSIAATFDDLYYLERACEVQVLAQSTQLPLKIVDAEVCRKTREQFAADDSYARAHLASIRRILDRECPDYAQ